jgi:alkylation response protein AidB-like acyl-CoA dehydrogenase
MDFGYDARTLELRTNLQEFMEGRVEPAERAFHRQLEELNDPWAWDSAPVLRELRTEARERGLWNLFLPGESGAGLTNLQYAPLAEITGRSMHLAPPALNCAAPDTGNMEVQGDGFSIAQARLGPGRIHHCMRAIGMAERALEALCARAEARFASGRPLAQQGVIRDWIAESRVRIEQVRLLVLKTAWLMDTVGNKGAHTEIQAIKIATPATVQWILDKAIQVHGAGGLSQDFKLASMYAVIRSLRFADGPDEVHKNALARSELLRQSRTEAPIRIED